MAKPVNTVPVWRYMGRRRPSAGTDQAIKDLLRRLDFRLQRYDACGNLSLREWHRALFDRHMIRLRASRWSQIDTETLVIDVKSLFANPTGAIFPWSGPIQTRDRSHMVRDLTVHEALSSAHAKCLIGSDGRAMSVWSEFARETLDELRCPSFAAATARWPVMKDSLGEVCSRYGDRARAVAVDLSCTDDQLHAAWSAWLSAQRACNKGSERSRARKVEKKSPKFSAADRARWQQQHVLPYIDVNLLCSIIGMPSLSDKAMGQLLTGRNDVEQSVKEGIRPLARYLMSHATLSAMWSELTDDDLPLATPRRRRRRRKEMGRGRVKNNGGKIGAKTFPP